MKKLIIFFFLFLIVSCGSDNKVETEHDNVSKKTSITSIAKSNNPELSEGNKLFINGDIKGAINYYRKAISANRSLAYYNIGVSYYLLNDFENSSKYFKMALKENPDFLQAKINLSAALLHQNKANEAEQIINEVIKVDKSAKIFINAANIFLEKGDTARAYYYFEEANKLAPNMPFVKLNYGNFLISIGNFKQGIAILDDVEDKTYNIYYNLAQAYFATKNYEESIRNIKKAIQKMRTKEAYLLLAENYNKVEDYTLAAETYSNILKFDNSWNNRYKYAKYLYLSGDILSAERTLIKLKKEKPFEIKSYEFLYKIYDEKNFRTKAYNIAKEAFNVIKSDKALYLYTKDIMLHKKKYLIVKRLIFNKKNSDYINLAKTLFYIKQKKYSKAKQHLDLITSSLNDDYFIYKTFINIKYNNISDALVNVEKINKSKYEYLLLNFVINWNDKNSEKLLSLLESASGRIKKVYRKPKVTFSIKPNINDLDFSYQFKGDLDGFIRITMSPYAMNPDEMFTFLALGYKLLEENEKLKALIELKKSVVFSDGVETNNKAVSQFFKANYKESLKLFLKASKLIKKNPIILHNIGVVYMNLGDLDSAYKYFDMAVLFNRFMFPSYLGKAIIYDSYGQKEKSLLEYDNLLNNIKIFTQSDSLIPGFFIYSKYIALAGLGKYDKALSEILSQENQNVYLKAWADIIYYLKTNDIEKINNIKNLSFHRKNLIVKLVNILHKKDNNQLLDQKDRINNVLVNYANLYANKTTIKFNTMNDKYLMKDLVLSYIVVEDKDNALKELRQLTRKYFKYTGLYKSSFYYFLWQKDFINAEASYTSLARLDKKDIFIDYYKLLFFLLNYNEKRLHKQINAYIEKYPIDYRGLTIDLLNSFKSNRIKKMYNDLLSLRQLDPDFIKKTSLVINIEDL